MRLDVDAVLFDNDGVLVDSHHQVGLAWRQLADEFDLDIELLLSELAGVRAIETLRRHLPRTRAMEAGARLEDLEVQLADTTRPLVGAVDLLAQLPADAWTIVTSASRRLALARWHAAGIPMPGAVVTADDVRVGKPDPEPFLTAAHLLGVEPARCVVFEDSSSGGESGYAAGAVVVALGEQPWEIDPVARIGDLSEVTFQGSSDAQTIMLTIPDGDRPVNPIRTPSNPNS